MSQVLKIKYFSKASELPMPCEQNTACEFFVLRGPKQMFSTKKARWNQPNWRYAKHMRRHEKKFRSRSTQNDTLIATLHAINDHCAVHSTQKTLYVDTCIAKDFESGWYAAMKDPSYPDQRFVELHFVDD